MTIHIAASEELGRVVRRGIHEPARFVADNWLVGPCAAGAQAHVRARCDHWGLQGRERTRFLGSFQGLLGAIESPERIVLWTSSLWGDTAASWAFCAWRLASRPADPDIDIVFLGEAVENDADVLGHRYIPVRPADARRGMGEVRSLALTRVREMARSWRRLCGGSPILAAEDRRPRPTRQPLVALGAYQAGFFPRLDERGAWLSRFDELMFSCLGRQWSTPLDVFVSREAAGEELRRWLSLTGDVFLAARLAQWASHRDDEEPALESELYQAENVMRAARYRLSSSGQAIRRHGLGTLLRGAPLPVWGVTAYDPVAPWVVVERGGVQHLVRYQGGSTSSSRTTTRRWTR